MLFCVNTELDRECLRETYWVSLSKKGKQRQIKLSILLFIGLFLMCFGIFMFLGVPWQPCVWLGVSLAIAAVFTSLEQFVRVPRVVAKKNTKIFREAYGVTSLHTTLCFYGDFVEKDCAEKQNVEKSPYSKVKFLKETKNYIVLLETEKNSLLILDKSGFTTGNVKDFNRFIQSKILPCSK